MFHGRYSFAQLSELGRCGENEMPKLRNAMIVQYISPKQICSRMSNFSLRSIYHVTAASKYPKQIILIIAMCVNFVVNMFECFIAFDV